MKTHAPSVCTLLLALGWPATEVAAQPPSPNPVTAITGRVVSDSGQGIIGAEVVLLGSQLIARTGSRGQFRLATVPTGTWSVLIRAIGFLPVKQLVTVKAGQNDLGIIQLLPAAVALPELSVTGKVAVPSFSPGFATDLDGEDYCLQCGHHGRYLPAGASMTGDGLYLALIQFDRAKPPFGVEFRERPVGLGEFGPITIGTLECHRTARPIATGIDEGGLTAEILYNTGEVWALRLVRPVGECLWPTHLVLNGVLLAGTFTSRGWVTATASPDGSITIQGFSDGGPPKWTIPLTAVLTTTQQVGNVLLTPVGKGVAVALSENPYSWAVIDSSGSVTLRSSPFVSKTIDSAVGTLGLNGWRSHAVLSVRDGFVQTLESPGRSQGLFVVYDVIGRPVRVTRRGGASVLIASASDRRMVLGYRYNHPRGSANLVALRY